MPRTWRVYGVPVDDEAAVSAWPLPEPGKLRVDKGDVLGYERSVRHPSKPPNGRSSSPPAEGLFTKVMCRPGSPAVIHRVKAFTATVGNRPCPRERAPHPRYTFLADLPSPTIFSSTVVVPATPSWPPTSPPPLGRTPSHLRLPQLPGNPRRTRRVFTVTHMPSVPS